MGRASAKHQTKQKYPHNFARKPKRNRILLDFKVGMN
jgi:hypothetical protein